MIKINRATLKGRCDGVTYIHTNLLSPPIYRLFALLKSIFFANRFKKVVFFKAGLRYFLITRSFNSKQEIENVNL